VKAPRISPLPQKCALKAADYPPKWAIRRPPTCNRPAGHLGPHREYDKVATILHEWRTTAG
jgi:hypothetical protein